MNPCLLALLLSSCPEPIYDCRYDSIAIEHDIKRFPGRHITEANLAFARAHIEWLAAHQAFLPSEDYDAWLAEAERLRDCWYWLRIAWIIPTRQCDMDNLKGAIGSEEYDKALMPPPVPVWRFR